MPVMSARLVRPQRRRARASTAQAILFALLAVACYRPALAEDQPTAAMIEPVRTLASFMAGLPGGRLPTMFASSGVTIIENYPPFIFSGRNAVKRWEAGFRAHAAEGQLTELVANFGPAQDFTVIGARAYFVLPTTWTGRTAGKRFEESGAWSFVLVRADLGWRVLGYGWGVTAYTEHPR